MNNDQAKVLIVEPDITLAESYARVLYGEFDITWCQSAADAIERLAHSTPDIVVLELALPGHNGIDIIYDLQSYEETKDIPIVVLSYLSPSDLMVNRKTLDDLSIHSFLYKPITRPRKLAEELKKISMVKS